jgi:hypothetical protein
MLVGESLNGLKIDDPSCGLGACHLAGECMGWWRAHSTPPHIAVMSTIVPTATMPTAPSTT